MAGKTNLGNAAFFAIKGLKKDIADLQETIQHINIRLEVLEDDKQS